MTVRNIRKSLIVMEDLTQGVGEVTQRNRTGYQLDLPLAVNSEAEMTALDITRWTRARVYSDIATFQDYVYDEGAQTGIPPDVGTGSWIAIVGGTSSAEGIAYDNTASGLTADNVQLAIDELAEVDAELRTSQGATIVKTSDGISIQVKLDADREDIDSLTDAVNLNSNDISKLGSSAGADNIGSSTGNSVQVELDALAQGQTGGVVVFTTFALLDAYTPTSEQEQSSFKVTNDPDTSKNGYYSWVSGTTYTKDADLTVNSLIPNNVDSVSSGAVFDEVNLNRVGYITSGLAEFMNFNFDNNTLEFTSGATYLQSKKGLVVISNADLSFDDSTRFIFWDNGRNTLIAAPADVSAQNDSELYLIACLIAGTGSTTRTVTFCSTNKYKVDGVWANPTEATLSDTFRKLNRGRQGVAASATDNPAFEIDFTLNTVKINEGVFLYPEGDANYPLIAATLSFDPVNHRYLYLDLDTNEYIFKNIGFDDSLFDGNVILLLNIFPSNKKVQFCSARHYTIDGVSYKPLIQSDLEVNRTSANDIATIGGGAGVDNSTVVIEFDTSAQKVRIPTNKNLFLFAPTRNVQLSTTNIPVVGDYYETDFLSSHRILVFNFTTLTLRGITTSTASGETGLLGTDDVLVARFHPTTKVMQYIASHTFKIDDITYNNYYSNPIENHALLDYVIGQEAMARKFSIPVCDLYRESGISFDNKDPFIDPDQLHPNSAGYEFIAKQTTDFISRYAAFTDLTGKTIGVFGGSFSVRVDSQACKDVWVSELGVSYTDYGIGGAGFAKAGNYIHNQVDGAAVHDIYILWCSTNDATANQNIGDISSQTDSDQNGGIYVAVTKILTLNPTAKILMFNSLKAYSANYLYDETVIRT